MASNRTGVLLVNVGTPDSPSVPDVRRYLREFLGDPDVIDLPAPIRWMLLNLFILPFRPKRSAEAYQKIWGEEGSPLLRFGREAEHAVAKSLGSDYEIRLAMRYGSPSIDDGLRSLHEANVGEILIFPLFPQYAEATTGSVLARSFEVIAGFDDPPPIRTIDAFYAAPEFIGAMKESCESLLADFRPDHVLMSFHGLPEAHIRKADASGSFCLERDDCCDSLCESNRSCYSAQAHATARAFARAAELDANRWSIAFQSRLGPSKWLGPDLVDELPRLAGAGVRRIAVLCPAFVADCLETLEEVGIRAREQWLEVGGEELLLLPCVNAHPSWIRGMAELIERRSGR